MTTIIPGRPGKPIVVDVEGSPSVTVRQGIAGPAGPTGPAGPAGVGVPVGGTTGQALVKNSATDYDTGWATVSGGGGISDGDKGDITVSGGGATWTIDAGAVSLSKMANLAASTILGNNTGSPATPIALTAAQVKTLLAIAAGDVSGLAAVATSGLASDLTGILPAASFNDTTHGNRAGGALHANVVAAGASGFMTGADKTKLDAISGTNTGDQTITLTGNVTGSGTGSFATTIGTGVVTLAMQANMATASVVYRKTAGSGAPEVQTLATLKTDLGLTGTNSGDQTITLTSDVTGSGTGSFATTIAAQAVTNAKLANVATATLKGRTTAGTGSPEDLTATQATALLNTFTTALKGLVPASGSAAGNFLRDDGTWAASGGGAAITVQDEGSNITTALGTLNFVGAGVTVTGGATATVTIPGGGGSFDFGMNEATAGLVIY